MSLFEEVLSLNKKELLDKWLELCDDCENTQKEVLLDILNNAKNTEIGQRFNFEKIKSIEEYQQKVPILEYEDIEEYIEKMALAKEDVLFPGKTSFFISTSGTTGNSKKIPESEKSSKAKSAVLKLRNLYLTTELIGKIKKNNEIIQYLVEKGIDLTNLDSNSFMDKFYFYSVTSASPNNKTKGGIDIGFASGKTFDNSSFANSLSYPKEIMGLKDGEATMYLSMLFSLIHEDVVIITSNNAGRVYARVKYAQEHAKEIIADIKNGTINKNLNLSKKEREIFESYIQPNPERATFLQDLLKNGKEYFIPKYYWPHLIASRFWLTGSVGVNVDKLKEYLPDNIIYYDVGYGASEGKINIPHQSGVGSGTLSIASIFYEFLSLETGDILTADKLELGKDYELILTNYGGLYRYPLHDIVRVTGFVGNTPDIEFITKSKEILNIAQEKVPAPSIVEILTEFLKNKELILVQSQIFEDLNNSNYQIFIELEDENSIKHLEKEFDDLVRTKFELYDRNRKFNSINSLEFNLMKTGWQKHLYESKEKKDIPQSQVKIETIINEKPDLEWIKGD